MVENTGITRWVVLSLVLLTACSIRPPADPEGHPATGGRTALAAGESHLRRAPATAMVPPAARSHAAFADGGLPGSDKRVNQDLTVRAQNEPAAAANPGDPLHLVAAWCDNRLFYFDWNLQKTDLAHGVSFDGGQTWQSQRIDFAAIPPGALTADPSVVIDSAGNVYLGILRYSPYDRSSPALNKVLVARSTDGGLTYTEPVEVDAGSMDKPLLAVDGTTLYVVWTEFPQVYFSKSVDGGATFSARLQISSQPGNGPAPAVGPSGEIYVLWADRTDSVWFDRSLDGGATWATDVAVTSTMVLPRSPLVGGFRNPVLPSLAVDRSGGSFHGRLYAVWDDGRFGDPDVLMAWSADGGASWSAPVRVNDDASGNDADQFLPWVTVDDDGAVHVVFLDRRGSLDNGTTATYLATSTDGGASFGPNVPISDGAFTPTDFFSGDYNAIVAAGDSVYPFWPDSRYGDQDLFTRAVNLDDFDNDTRLNDGDGDGHYAGTPCTGGQTTNCDDNCPGTPNTSQADADSDGVGDACDNCPATPNPAQADNDRDGEGNACDGCPDAANKQPGDSDGDGYDGCVDNCPDHDNPTQDDGDNDEVGNACDPCPASPLDDIDGDGFCGDVDNCPEIYNPVQRDSDSDGIGDLCDKCPEVSDPGQPDADFDGESDACDCADTEVTDFEKRRPPPVDGVRVLPDAGGHRLVWKDSASADTFSVSRGLLSELAPGSYGDCIAEGVEGIDGIALPDTPPSDDGYFYLVTGWDADCGLGSAGADSDELKRVNGNPGACDGAP